MYSFQQRKGSNGRMSCRQRETLKILTSGRLVAVVPMSEVLRILHHRNTSHPYNNRIRTGIQSAGGNDSVVDMMKRAGRVFLTADHSHWTWKKSRKKTNALAKVKMCRFS